MAKLTTNERKHISKSNFAIPEKAPGPGSYPIENRVHAAVALSLVAKNGTPAEKSRVHGAVCSKYKDLPSCQG
jgi:hypothetical protein